MDNADCSKTPYQLHWNNINEKTSCKSCLTSKQSKHIFLQLNHLIWGKTLQSTPLLLRTQVERSAKKFNQEPKLVVAPFCQQPQASMQPTSRNLTSLHRGKMSFFERAIKDLPPANLVFFTGLWPGFNNAINVFRTLPSLIETSIFASWSLVRQGAFALWPLVYERQTASSWNRAAGWS